jgi:hypothetical protein
MDTTLFCIVVYRRMAWRYGKRLKRIIKEISIHELNLMAVSQQHQQPNT